MPLPRRFQSDTLAVDLFLGQRNHTSSRASWREDRKEEPKTHANKRKSIPEPVQKWHCMFKRLLNWIKRDETLQMAENPLGFFERKVLEIVEGWLEGHGGYQGSN